MRILYISDYLPYPPVTGDLIRNYNLIRRIAGEHQVSIIGFQDPTEPDGRAHLLEFCQRVEAIPLPRRPKALRVLRMLQYQARGIPFEFEFLGSSALSKAIRSAVDSEDYDLVQIEHSRMAPYIQTLPADGRLQRVLSFHNVASSQYGRISTITNLPVRRARMALYSRLLMEWEPRFARRFDRCIAVSDLDRRALMKANPRLQVSTVPNGVDSRALQPLAPLYSWPTLLMIGNMGYAPNADGAAWFCDHALPRVRAELPGAEISIVGSSPPPELVELSGPGIRVVGRVENVLPFYEKSAVAVVPLRAGGGTRLKVLEAMALGRPVVSTRIGCEGLEVSDGEHLLIADTAEQFAACVIRLLRDPVLYQSIAENARRLVVTKYDWDALAGTLEHIYVGLLNGAGQKTPVQALA